MRDREIQETYGKGRRLEEGRKRSLEQFSDSTFLMF